ncbi:MAG: hypothetical protein K2X32_05945 [Phycisphaerales bacterium]|nr:hypothetical protein [Phycisphaerales bacterium]
MRRRRGVSILEAVLSTLLLAMVAVSMAAAVTHVQKSAEMGKLRVAAHEVANRLALQWLDDENSLQPLMGQAYDDGTFKFRWELSTMPLTVSVPAGSALNAPTEGPPAKLLNAQLLLVVNVYEAIPDGVGGTYPGMQLAELRRTHNPQARMTGNPDSMARLAKDAGRTATIMSGIMGGNNATPAAGTGPGAGGGTGGAGGTRREGGRPPRTTPSDRGNR